MSEAASIAFESTEWVEKLLRYADALIDRLEGDVTAIADTGIALEAKDRQSLIIDPFRPEKDDGFAGSMFPSRPADPLSDRSQKDVAFFQAWLAQPESHTRPLLLLAPFGCGKSVTLGLFTLILARTLRDWCESPKGALPWVPLPVRLREWPGKGELWTYMTTLAQEDVNGNPSTAEDPEQHRLTAQELRQLRQHPRLLPLFDGLDELPQIYHATAIKQIYADRYYGRRHVLSSREDHGIESSTFTATATLHTLHALDEIEAETFICNRFGLARGDTKHPIIARYREAKPAINELFRRPLFLMAWCAKATAWQISQWHPRFALPVSLSGLMEAVLEHVLDRRIFHDPTGRESDEPKLREELLGNRHRLGAVLAIHADVGFGEPVRKPAEHVEDGSHQHAFTDVQQYERYAGFAIKAGLLIKRPGGTCAEKIPVVEYLIGYYYAWLAEAHKDSELTQSRCRQLACTFQRRFWWRDHDQVWLYAFDVMWHGDGSQQKLAAELVRWVLNLSEECLAEANWVLPSTCEEDADRQPYSCWRFVLRVLLPTTGGVGESVPGSLIDEAMKQFEMTARGCWKFRVSNLGGLEGVAERRPELVNRWLCDCLEAPEYENDWGHIATMIGLLGEQINRPTINKLLECLSKLNYNDERHVIVSALGSASAHLGVDEFDVLLTYFGDVKYKGTWRSIALALRKVAAHLGSDASEKLLIYLGNDKYQAAWSEIALIFSEGAVHTCPETVEELRNHLSNDKYNCAWPSIAKALGAAATHMSSDAVRQLLIFLGMDKYEQAWDPIADALAHADAHLGPDAVKQLQMYLGNGRYRKAWNSIARTLVRATAHRGPNAVKQLLMDFVEEHEGAWPEIVDALGEAAICVGRDGVRQLLAYLGNVKYKKAWRHIAKALRKVAMHLGPDAIKLLLGYLGDDRYEDGWPDIVHVVGKADVYIGPDALKQMLTYFGHEKYRWAWLEIAEIVGKRDACLESDAIEQVLSYLGNNRFEKALHPIACIIRGLAMHLGPDGTKQLLTYLGSNKHEQAWEAIAETLAAAAVHVRTGALKQGRSIADDAVRRGWICYALRIVDALSLTWFVRNVDPKKEPGLRIEYGVAGRNDADVLFPADKRFAPIAIRRLLGNLNVTDDNGDVNSSADWITVGAAIKDVLKAVCDRKTHAEIEAFDRALGVGKTRGRRLTEVILPLVKTGLDIKTAEDLWLRVPLSDRSKTKGKNKTSGKTARLNDDAEKYSQIRVNFIYLRKLKDAHHANLVSQIYHAVLAARERKTHWTKLRNPVVVCPFCGCIHKLRKPSADDKCNQARSKSQPLVGTCKVCTEELRLPEEVVEHPLPYHRCSNRKCGANYAIASAQNPWLNREKSGNCFRPDAECQEDPLITIRTLTASPNNLQSD